MPLYIYDKSVPDDYQERYSIEAVSIGLKPSLEKRTTLGSHHRQAKFCGGIATKGSTWSLRESIIDLIDQFIAGVHLEHPKIEDYKFTFVDESWTTMNAKSQLKAI